MLEFMPFRNDVIDRRAPIDGAELPLKSVGPQEIAHFPMGLADAKLYPTFSELLMKVGEHASAGDIDRWRIGQIAYDELKLGGRLQSFPYG